MDIGWERVVIKVLGKVDKLVGRVLDVCRPGEEPSEGKGWQCISQMQVEEKSEVDKTGRTGEACFEEGDDI